MFSFQIQILFLKLRLSINPNNTEQELINLAKLAEQEKNQRAIKIKKRNSKQTRDIQLTGTLSAITKILEKLDYYTQKFGEVIKINSEVEILQLAIENIQLAIRKIRDEYPGIIYDTSLGITLSNMKTARSLFILEKDSHGDVFRN